MKPLDRTGSRRTNDSRTLEPHSDEKFPSRNSYEGGSEGDLSFDDDRTPDLQPTTST